MPISGTTPTSTRFAASVAHRLNEPSFGDSTSATSIHIWALSNFVLNFSTCTLTSRLSSLCRFDFQVPVDLSEAPKHREFAVTALYRLLTTFEYGRLAALVER